MSKPLYDIAEQPPLGFVPQQMHAWVVREERFGEPVKAFQKEVLDVPDIGDDEVLVYVMAAGINYNNVWAGLGVPVNVIATRNKQGEPEPFHIGGSDASGIIYKVGKNVRQWKIGDEVVVHCGMWDVHDTGVLAGQDPMYAPSFRIWGYESNYGSFAQFTRVQAHQCVPRPQHLSWEEAASYMLVGATAYRMLTGWGEHQVQKNDVVLIWGGAGGLGSMAIQIARAKGAIPVAVVSSDDKIEYCKQLGAKGAINRGQFKHWGMLPHWKDTVGYNEWLKGARGFGKAIWDVLGEKRSPRIVFEHPGETTIPSSIFVCETGGMVVICAGTTGYNATVDLRYLWMRQKRLQGSHFANDEQAQGFNDLVLSGDIDPCMSKAVDYEGLPQVHQLMYENKHPHGNMAVLVGAPGFGQGITRPELRKDHPTAPMHDDWDGARGVPDVLPEASEDAAVMGKISMQLGVADIMHKGLIACQRNSSIGDITRIMLEQHIHAVIVTDEEQKPIGIVSQSDIVMASQSKTRFELRALTARDVMTHGCITCDVSSKLADAIALMTRHRIHRLVVVDAQDKAQKGIGLISMTDVLAHYVSG
ncbi:MAG: crotonyl-CoA carboxylase/reductase [Rhodoferax sp.]|nr:crotonyl-CoA carboxylase/reductase [Rhodoferax sp.]